MSDSQLQRVTLFEVKDENKKAIIAAYEALKVNAAKDGKSYILSIVLGEALPDQRSQGYAVVAKLAFASKADSDYYDTECPGHKGLRLAAGPLVEGLLTINFHPIDVQTAT